MSLLDWLFVAAMILTLFFLVFFVKKERPGR